VSPITPKPYTVCLARFRFLESEQQKIRPVIVVGRPYGERRILMAIPISSSSKAESVDVMLDNWEEAGLLKMSLARVHRLSAMLEDDLLEEMGSLNKKHQEAIETALRELLKL
jgi:mRNA-degrading endonuclease toxin of MazEF toxin-antitoxin module